MTRPKKLLFAIAAAARGPGELRIAMLGGSTAYGYGVNWDEAIPAQLERQLAPSGGPLSVVNLGVVGQPELPASTLGRRRHDDQQQQLAAMVARRFGNDSRVQYVPMRGVVDTADPSRSFDVMHLNADRNRMVAQRPAVAVRDFVPRLAD